MTQHTPGPWTVRDWRDKPSTFHEGGNAPFTIGSDGGVHIASLPNAEYEANARLIAAAPQMFAALLSARAAITDCPTLDSDPAWTAELDNIEAAIAAARGAK